MTIILHLLASWWYHSTPQKTENQNKNIFDKTKTLTHYCKIQIFFSNFYFLINNYFQMKPISAVLCTTFATWTWKRANRTVMPHFATAWTVQSPKQPFVPPLPTKLPRMAAKMSATVSARLSSCSAAWPLQRHGKWWKSRRWHWPNGTKKRPRQKRRPKAAQQPVVVHQLPLQYPHLRFHQQPVQQQPGQPPLPVHPQRLHLPTLDILLRTNSRWLVWMIVSRNFLGI